MTVSSGTIASLAATAAHLLGVAPPILASEPALETVVKEQRRLLSAASASRCLVFCPDALGTHIWPACPAELVPAIERHAPLRVSLLSVVPPVTPVCFASIFTGAQPAAHGIREYVRPVLSCDTLFDALMRANRTCAIVAVTDSSIDLIFRNRAIDYFSEANDAAVEQCARDIIHENRHSLVVVYQQEYDDLLHATEPFSDVCRQAVGRHVRSFEQLASAAAIAWSRQNHALVFAPDHGAHLVTATGHGDHGEDIPEDMQLSHWYGIHAAVSDLKGQFKT